jgi:hypothetical protein
VHYSLHNVSRVRQAFSVSAPPPTLCLGDVGAPASVLAE